MSEIFLGTVMARSDINDTRNTEALGRVLVLIRNKSDVANDEQFINPTGQNMCNTVSPDTLNRLKNTEVWAYVLQTNTGGAPGSYNSVSNITRTSSDGSDINISMLAPAAGYRGALPAGNNGTDPASAALNTTDLNFTPDNRDGAVKGTFSVPPVGATVAIMFINGKRGMPVVVGTLMGAAAINSVHTTDSGAMPGFPGPTEATPGELALVRREVDRIFPEP